MCSVVKRSGYGEGARAARARGCANRAPRAPRRAHARRAPRPAWRAAQASAGSANTSTEGGGARERSGRARRRERALGGVSGRVLASHLGRCPPVRLRAHGRELARDGLSEGRRVRERRTVREASGWRGDGMARPMKRADPANAFARFSRRCCAGCRLPRCVSTLPLQTRRSGIRYCMPSIRAAASGTPSRFATRWSPGRLAAREARSPLVYQLVMADDAISLRRYYNSSRIPVRLPGPGSGPTPRVRPGGGASHRPHHGSRTARPAASARGPRSRRAAAPGRRRITGRSGARSDREPAAMPGSRGRSPGLSGRLGPAGAGRPSRPVWVYKLRQSVSRVILIIY